MNVNSLGDRIFADGRGLRGGHSGFGVSPISSDWCSLKRLRHSNRTQGDGRVTAEAEIRGRYLQASNDAKYDQRPTEASREAWEGFFPRASRRKQPCRHLETQSLA